jgi:hypothetical protein
MAQHAPLRCVNTLSLPYREEPRSRYLTKCENTWIERLFLLGGSASIVSIDSIWGPTSAFCQVLLSRTGQTCAPSAHSAMNHVLKPSNTRWRGP